MTKGKKVQLFQIIRNALRILCLIIFFYWLIFTSYANCINYRESIKEENVKQEDKKLKKHDEKTNKYNKNKELTIAEIEEDILKQIEEKSGKKGLLKKWGKEELPKLRQLDEEIEKLAKKNNPSEEDTKNLDRKRKDYEKNLEEAKENTIQNIQDQLKKNGLTVTDLNDKQDWKESLRKDPSRFFLISPLDKTAKLMGLRNSLDNGWLIVGEMIFKLIVIKLLFNLVSFWETSAAHEGMAKMQNPYLSVEEKEKIQQEISPLFKYMLFNGLMIFLFTIVLLFVHPFFIDRTSAWYCEPTKWYYWVLPSFFASLLSIISSEFIRQGRILSKQEIKDYLAKSWIMIVILNLLFLVLVPSYLGRNQGVYWFCFCNGVVDFVVNLFSVWIFGLKSKTKKHH